jgi:N-methylhydantoinase B
LRYSSTRSSPIPGGPGQFRGGLALTREYRLVAEEATMTIRTDRRSHLPYGLQGGHSGTLSLTVLNPGTPAERVLPVLPMEGVQLRRGDVIRHTQAGGGGYGPPAARDSGRVLEDVIDQKLTVAYAAREYGVVVTPDGRSVDEDGTARLRRILGTRAEEGA